MNNVLLVFFVDGSKLATSFPLSVELDEALKESQDLFGGREIKKYFYINNSKVGASTLQNYATLTEDNKIKFDQKNSLIDQYLIYIRGIRDSLLKNLDVEFIKAIEEDCEECKNHIVKIKRHLRFLPDIAEQHMESMDSKEVLKYNAFGNIYESLVVRGGSGYEKAPEVHIEPPMGQYEGAQAKAIALLDGDKVAKIEIIDHGAGYVKRPQIRISAPENGECALAVVAPPENSFASMSASETVTLKDYS